MNIHTNPSASVKTNNRFALRDGTAESHAQLDGSIARFTTLDAYCRYLAGQYLFRKRIEERFAGTDAQLCEASGWKLLALLDAIRRDMIDLNVSEPVQKGSSAPFPVADRSALIGSLYVIEGSNIGARLLYRDALQLGLGAEYGASHLSLQSADKSRWPDFLALLEKSDIDISVAITSANHLFSIAHHAFAGPK